MEESWTAQRGNLQILSHMWSKGLDRKNRNEKLGLTFHIYTPTELSRIDDEMNYRTYSKEQMQSLLDQVPEFETVATYDFHYRLDRPITIDARTEDVVFVLRRKK